MTGAALVLSVVDTRSRESHLVAVDTAALHRRSGRYPALCGAEVITASLTTPAARHCRDCANQAQGATTRRGGAVRRLWRAGRRQTSRRADGGADR
jgi:hypothetical protein